MTRGDKDLLSKDLCARLPYGVKVTTTNSAVKIGVISGISIKNKISVETKDADIVFDCTEVKPYLRPMSSMTDEEYAEYVRLVHEGYAHDTVDYLNSIHVDYRGLIQRGLAIEVTEENNPYKLDCL